MEVKKTICVDFDGVIHSYLSGWQGADVIPDPIVPHAISQLYYYLANYRVAVYSARSGQPGGIEAMKAFIEKADQEWRKRIRTFELPDFELIGRLEFPSSKPPAILYIDDRAYRFEGTFPTTEWIEAHSSSWVSGLNPDTPLIDQIRQSENWTIKQ